MGEGADTMGNEALFTASLFITGSVLRQLNVRSEPDIET